MFIGSYIYLLDEKGRLVIPSKYRAEIKCNLFMMKGYDGCISIYKESEFNKALENLSKLQFEREKARLHLRVLLDTVVELKIDSAGRIQIPVNVLEKYKIGKSVKIIGLLDHFEIWDEIAWNNYQEEHEKDFEKDAEDLLNYENK